MRGELRVRRRRQSPTPLRTRRLAFGPGATAMPAGPFPGFAEMDTGGHRSRWVSGSLAALVHGSLVVGVLLYAWLNPTVL